jgi:hypothetical protein
MSQSLHVPAATAFGFHQFEKGGGSDTDGDPFGDARWTTPVDVLVVNDTEHDVEVTYLREALKDRLRIWVRDV